MKAYDEKTELLEAAIEAMRNDTPSAAEESDAVARVRAQIDARSAAVTHPAFSSWQKNIPDVQAAKAASWNSIEDYIAAIPAYLSGQLSPAQATLFEEEARQSIPLRRALNEARGRVRTHASVAARSGSMVRMRWLAAVATVAAIALAVVLVIPQLPSRDQSRLAQINTVQGELYQIVNGGLEKLTPGTWIDGRQRIRSGHNSMAMIVLDDGSRIELDERSELSMTRRGAGNRIDVSRGRIFVEASPQGSGTLDVFTDEFEVSVTGTIFEVAHGAKGSRVAVIEGSVNVSLRGNTTSLAPGDVMGSRADYLARNIAEEISWSENADQYIAMLQEVASLQQDLAAVMAVPPRYSTRLLDLAPASTAIYVAVPNAPEKAAEIYEVIRARMQSSQILGDVWNDFEQQAESRYLDEMMIWMREIGYALGEETVFAMTMVGTGDAATALPVVLSEVDADSFAASFNDQLELVRHALAAAGHNEELPINLIYHPTEARDEQLSILLYQDLLVATTDAALMAQMYENMQFGSSTFTETVLHEMLQASYEQGTEILGAAYIPSLLSASGEDLEAIESTGLHNAEVLVAQYQRSGNGAVLTADLLFSGPRTGAMSLLATPGPMGSLEFFSTDTTVVAALLSRDPGDILDEFDTLFATAGSEIEVELQLFYNLMATLGGEIAIGLDGPVLPTPAWKAVIEAYDAAGLQASIEASVARFNAVSAAEGISLALAPSNVSGYSGYQVSLAVDATVTDEALNIDSTGFQYAYVDGYLVAAPNAALVARAIGVYQSGSSLPTAAEYRELMLRDGYLDFSAVYFSRLGELLDSLMQRLPATVTAEQQAAIASLNIEVGPSMTSVLALPDRMRITRTGGSDLTLQLFSNLALLQPLLENLQEPDAAVY